MLDWALTIAAATGATLIVTYSFIFESLRGAISSRSNNLGYLVHCPMCMGVWVGLLVGIYYDLDLFKAAMLTSLASFVVGSVISTTNSFADYLELNLLEEEDQDDRSDPQT